MDKRDVIVICVGSAADDIRALNHATNSAVLVVEDKPAIHEMALMDDIFLTDEAKDMFVLELIEDALPKNFLSEPKPRKAWKNEFENLGRK